MARQRLKPRYRLIVVTGMFSMDRRVFQAWSAKAAVAISKWKEAVSVIDEKQIKAEERYDGILGATD
jgi:hypothetical protein